MSNFTIFLNYGIFPTGIKFFVSGDIGSGGLSFKNVPENSDIDVSEGGYVDVICNTSVTQEFALRYLKCFGAARFLSKTFVLNFSEGCPIKVSIFFNKNHGHLYYYLAPKIDSNSDSED